MFQTISHEKYFAAGLFIIILCAFLTVIFNNYFKNPIDHTKSYTLDQCMVSSINQSKVPYNCWYQQIIYQVDLPCVQVLVDTSFGGGILMYRNYGEKAFVKNSGYREVLLFTDCFIIFLDYTLYNCDVFRLVRLYQLPVNKIQITYTTS